MITVTPLKDAYKDNFIQLFNDYYAELDCGEDVPRLVNEYILPDLLAGLISIDLIKDGDVFAGFIIYQIDDIDNDWNFMEGWGDVREIYITPSLRRAGLGKFILFTAEMKMKERGADKAYALPTPQTEQFFIHCGYEKTEAYDDELECYVFEKHCLNPKCNCK